MTTQSDNIKARVWSGMHEKWVFASKVYRCPDCGDQWGGADTGFVKGGPYDRDAGPVADKQCLACEPFPEEVPDGLS